jgi:putative ABC transport system substrate-binding protein
MRRREFLGALGGVAAIPFTAGAQEKVRLVGVLANVAASAQTLQGRLATFRQRLQQLGWTEGVNVRIEYRSGMGDLDQLRKNAADLVTLAPDVILAQGVASVTELQRVTKAISVVFVTVADPVGAGMVESLSQPGGNFTGFLDFEYGLSAKWLELLREIVPRATRVGVIRNPANLTGIGQFAAIQGAAMVLGIELRPIDVRVAEGIERGVAAFASASGDGIIITSAGAAAHRDLMIRLAARHRLPTIYPFRYYVDEGGLISYGPDFFNSYRQAASYVDRILRGERPADLPVQAPTKYELVINLKTAKALGLTVPPTLLARADEVIE